MGQLEKYGLYVLCLVIFLILGVAIWGGDPATPTGGKELNKGSGPQAAASKDPAKEPIKEQPKAGAPKDFTNLLSAIRPNADADKDKAAGRAASSGDKLADRKSESEPTADKGK